MPPSRATGQTVQTFGASSNARTAASIDAGRRISRPPMLSGSPLIRSPTDEPSRVGSPGSGTRRAGSRRSSRRARDFGEPRAQPRRAFLGGEVECRAIAVELHVLGRVDDMELLL